MSNKAEITYPTDLFINGEFVPAADGKRIDIFNPYTGQKLCDVAEAGVEDVNRAVAAARAALPKWRDMSAEDRGRLLLKLADKMDERFDELVQIEMMDTGHPIRDVRLLDVPRSAACFRYFGGMADKIMGSVVPTRHGFLNYVLREPVGVVGGIVPWNFPMLSAVWKLGPALAAGNTIVLKTSEITPLSSLKIAELANEVGFPKGVINIVQGYGHIAGQHLVEHLDVNKVSFTGSTATARKLIMASAGNMKRLQLELGGKGPNIVFEDANIANAVKGSLFAIYHNQGQACIAGSRLILQESIAEEFIERFKAVATTIRQGDPSDPATEMGPVASKPHQQRVLSLCEIAAKEGEIVYGGKAPDRADLRNGYFIEPTMARAKPTDTVFQEEVFGPFVSVTTFKTEEEAIKLANATRYGLGSGLWTDNLQRAHRVSRDIRAGMVWINCYKVSTPGSPFGGVGESGYGRDCGFEAIHEYTTAKSYWVNYDHPLMDFYPR